MAEFLPNSIRALRRRGNEGETRGVRGREGMKGSEGNEENEETRRCGDWKSNQDIRRIVRDLASL